MNTLIKKWSEDAAKTLYVPIDIECGGLQHAMHNEYPEIPEGTTGAQFYPILEITAKFYDGNFQELAEPMTFVIQHDIDDLNQRCSQWVKNQFGDTLFHECHSSETSLEEADKAIAKRIRSFGASKSFILGNSVDLDRSFVQFQMPEIAKSLHYRLIDVSTLKTIFQDMFGSAAVYKKRETHRTELDITETMEELAFYRKNFIKSRLEVVTEMSRPKSKSKAV
ncbi:oligoribonuclease [Vibrio sp. D431a]|uniref:oligoribonuclease n=1 Tax=Vibrio sp. D431a TaxID=2837388 RepID=UPI002556B784|nr:oligoribonuclease [Vibrio sp. D431a]MDK9790665.1 oligoribonuclease [Vibrio sp. D431a]